MFILLFLQLSFASPEGFKSFDSEVKKLCIDRSEDLSKKVFIELSLGDANHCQGRFVKALLQRCSRLNCNKINLINMKANSLNSGNIIGD